jgi:hypothetical protein
MTTSFYNHRLIYVSYSDYEDFLVNKYKYYLVFQYI